MNQKQKEVVMHESKIEMKEEVFFLIDTIVWGLLGLAN
jgi:hypothetical protein